MQSESYHKQGVPKEEPILVQELILEPQQIAMTTNLINKGIQRAGGYNSEECLDDKQQESNSIEEYEYEIVLSEEQCNNSIEEYEDEIVLTDYQLNNLIEECESAFEDDQQQTKQQSEITLENTKYNIMNSQQYEEANLRIKAQLAIGLIKMIQKPNQISELEKEAYLHYSTKHIAAKVKSLPLAGRILRAMINLRCHEKSRDDVLKLFTTGVKLPESIFHQARIHGSKNSQQKFVFCPNASITSQMFQIIGSSPKNMTGYRRWALKGYKEISKTVSVALIWCLAQLIDEYRFSSEKIRSKISFNYPKIVYWSIQLEDTQQNVWEQFLNQLPQIKRVYTIQKIIDKKISIAKFYEQNYSISTHLIIDQINLVASQNRKIQSATFQNRKPSDLYQQQLEGIKTLIKTIEKVAKKFTKTFYLSSTDIQPNFLKKCDLATDGRQTIVPLKKQNAPKAFIRILDQAKFPNQNLNKYKNGELKSESHGKCLFLHLKQRIHQGNFFFFTFYDILENIRTWPFEKFNKKNMETLLLEKFQKFVQNSSKIVKQEFQTHFYKQDQYNEVRKITVLLLSSEISYIMRKKNFQIKQQLLNKCSQWQLYQIPLKNIKLDLQDTKIILPQSFFVLDQQNAEIRLRLPAQLVYAILQPKIQKQLYFYILNPSKWLNQILNSQSQGSIIQKLIVLGLKHGQTSAQFNYKTGFGKSNTKYYPNIKKGSYSFSSIQRGLVEQNFCGLVKQSFEKMINQSYKCAVFEPVKKEFQRMELTDVGPRHHNTGSKAIDLMMVKFNHLSDQTTSIVVDVIDVTIQNQISVVQRKIKAFLNIFLLFTDKTQNTIILELNGIKTTFSLKLNYYVFCLENTSPKLLDKLKNDGQLKKQLIFKGQSNNNSFKVKLINQKTCLLDQIGFISIEKDLTFETKEGKNLYAKILVNAVKLMIQKRATQKSKQLNLI